MVITIKGADQSICSKIHDAAEKGIKALIPNHVKYDLYIKIEIKHIKPEARMDGYCMGDPDNHRVYNDFTIVIKEDLSVSKMLHVLNHELMHVYQRASGKLQLIEKNGIEHAVWNGEDCGEKSLLFHRERPWEIEAIDWAEKCYKKACLRLDK